MKFLVALALVAVVVARPEDTYNSRYDDFDVTQLTENPRLMKSYIDCFLEKGRCTPEGTDFSKWIPEAVQTNCAKCTDKQKVNAAKVIKSIMADHAADWDELRNKYDPEHKRDEDLKNFVSQYAA